MSHRSTVSPSTLPIDLREEGVVVEYLDGREAFYRGVPEKVHGTVRTRPGVLVQVLVTDGSETQGVMTYVNDRNTHDEILEETGVGRVFVEPGEETELFPGVRARADGHAVEVEADPEVAGGRVFVFAEDELQERSFEIVGDGDEPERTDGGGQEDAREDDGRGDGDREDRDREDGDPREDPSDDASGDDESAAGGDVEEGDVDEGTVEEGAVDEGSVDGED